ncbi:putative GNAT family acetyltransferase [Podospora australis]|uniref:GNAT family acetyltransferase n=1 Tax=Podospora australis TaxID=1536484 RepID=A0AAN6WML2_9PEZI|nr:putative GNAT family acetyltransferase [Podospora australis]
MPSTPAPTTSPTLPEGYALHSGYPAIPDYCHLRAASGLTPKTPVQAAPVATGSWYGCYITYDGSKENDSGSDSLGASAKPKPVAMGRVIGDGGWYFHIVDMAVLPEHQRRGLGDAVLKNLLAHIDQHAPAGYRCINLLADPPGRKLYERNGFIGDGKNDQVGLGMMVRRELADTEFRREE